MPQHPKQGRPPSKIDTAQIETLASLGCTLDEISAVIGLSVRQLIRRQKDPAFHAAIERGRAKGRASLRRMQWQAAQTGNVTAQIWLGKQLLGQRSFEKYEPPVQAKHDRVTYQWVPSPPPLIAESSTARSPANTDSTPPPASSKDFLDP